MNVFHVHGGRTFNFVLRYLAVNTCCHNNHKWPIRAREKGGAMDNIVRVLYYPWWGEGRGDWREIIKRSAFITWSFLLL